jgi:hypothetical protein
MQTIFDDEARAEMLCYLVVGELVTMARTGDWLRTDHLVELSLVWMRANGANPEWRAGPYRHRAHGGRPGTLHPREIWTHNRESTGITLYGRWASRLSSTTRWPDPRAVCCETAARVDMLHIAVGAFGRPLACLRTRLDFFCTPLSCRLVSWRSLSVRVTVRQLVAPFHHAKLSL